MPSNTPSKPRKTSPGLGVLPRIDSAEIKRTQDAMRGDTPAPDSRSDSREDARDRTAPRRLRDSLRREDPEEGAEPVPSSRRVEGSPRPPPVTVDKVGDGAMRLARSLKSVPQRIAAKVPIEKAPLDARAAFLLSLVDGQTSVEALADMSGISEADVKEILARLARLGLLSLG